MDDADAIALADVEVLADNQLIPLCRVNGRIVSVPPEQMLPGTTVRRHGDRGTLVLTRKACHDARPEVIDASGEMLRALMVLREKLGRRHGGREEIVPAWRSARAPVLRVRSPIEVHADRPAPAAACARTTMANYAMMSMLRYIDDRCLDTPVVLLYCVRTRNDIIFADDLREMRRRLQNFHMVLVLSQPDVAWNRRLPPPGGSCARETARHAGGLQAQGRGWTPSIREMSV
jgi:hypothetical protein